MAAQEVAKKKAAEARERTQQQLDAKHRKAALLHTPAASGKSWEVCMPASSAFGCLMTLARCSLRGNGSGPQLWALQLFLELPVGHVGHLWKEE